VEDELSKLVEEETGSFTRENLTGKVKIKGIQRYTYLHGSSLGKSKGLL